MSTMSTCDLIIGRRESLIVIGFKGLVSKVSTFFRKTKQPKEKKKDHAKNVHKSTNPYIHK